MHNAVCKIILKVTCSEAIFVKQLQCRLHFSFEPQKGVYFHVIWIGTLQQPS